MTTNYHTPLATGAELTSANWNAPLSELDSGIGNAGQASARVYLTSDFTFGGFSQQTLSWDTESWDTDDMWDSGSPTVLTVNTAGKYIVSANVFYSSEPTRPELYIFKNNTASGSEIAVLWQAGGFAQNVSAVAEFGQGDTIIVVVEHSTGSNRTISSGSHLSWVAAQLIA